MDGGACWATVHRVAKSRTWLKWLSTRTHTHTHARELSPGMLAQLFLAVFVVCRSWFMLFSLVYPGSCGASLLNFQVLYIAFLKQICSLLTHFSNSSVFITYLPISSSVLLITLDIGNPSWYPVAFRSWFPRIRLIYPIWFSAYQQRVKQKDSSFNFCYEKPFQEARIYLPALERPGDGSDGDQSLPVLSTAWSQKCFAEFSSYQVVWGWVGVVHIQKKVADTIISVVISLNVISHSPEKEAWLMELIWFWKLFFFVIFLKWFQLIFMRFDSVSVRILLAISNRSSTWKRV